MRPGVCAGCMCSERCITCLGEGLVVSMHPVPVEVQRQEIAWDDGYTLPASPQRLAFARGSRDRRTWDWVSTFDLVTLTYNKLTYNELLIPPEKWRCARGAEVRALAGGQMIGKVAEADVMRPRNLSRVSPLTIIYHPTGQEYPPQHSCWFVEDMVEPHHIVRGLPVTVLIHSIGTEVKPIRVVSPVSTHPLPFPGQDMPGWFGKLFRISLPGPLIPAYGGAPVVVTDEPNRLVGFIIRSYYTQSGQFAAYCGLAWPL